MAADLVVFDPDAVVTVAASSLHQRHPLTPYTGRVLHGMVGTTFLRGRRVWDRGRFADRPEGELLNRTSPAATGRSTPPP